MINTTSIEAIWNFLQRLQTDICDQLSAIDGVQSFEEDHWTSKLGDGVSCVLENGAVIERGGVNISKVHGEQLPAAASQRNQAYAGSPFVAMGLSLVIHPKNPMAPTTHMNVRFFYIEPEDSALQPLWWFGGGFDLTPYYGFKEDCQHWHNMAKQACDPFGEDLYPQFKKACDDYFYLPHRQEHRGIGGIFFDDVQLDNFDDSFAFMRSVGEHFIEAYCPILERRKDMPYTEQQRAFQCMRRGRYVEFNLLFDRGTRFGIESSGRTESILVSMPPQVSWTYQHAPEPESPEARLITDYLTPRSWCTG